MEVEELVNAIRTVELTTATRASAIRELVNAIDWSTEGIVAEDVVEAIEEREATAQTIIDEGLALPHAMIDWPGDFHMVLGRSREGVRYVATGEKLHLIVLLVVGAGRERRHLEVLAAMANLLQDRALRRDLVLAGNVADIRRALEERARRPPRHPHHVGEVPRRSVAVVQHAVGLAESLSAQAVLLALDEGQCVPWEPLRSWSHRLLVIATRSSLDGVVDRPDTHLFDVPHASLSRMDRANLGLLLAAANGLVDHEREVVCVTGTLGQALDSITVTRPSAHFRAAFPEHEGGAAARIPPAVILRILSLAIELAAEGRESHPVGVMFVIGDTRHVLTHTQQLVLNPFHGFARRLRNVLDPSLAETVKEFALLDGAFIVENDGAIRSAGTYLIPTTRVSNLLGGLGARHQSAAAITAETRAMAVVVSQSTGTVTVFQRGGVVLTLERATLTRW